MQIDGFEVLTIPEIEELLRLEYREVYRIVTLNKISILRNNKHLYVLKDSFEAWYTTQNQYKKLSDLPADIRAAEINKAQREGIGKRIPWLGIDYQKKTFTLQEVAIILDVTMKEIGLLRHRNLLPGIMINGRILISRCTVLGWLNEMSVSFDMEVAYGVDTSER